MNTDRLSEIEAALGEPDPREALIHVVRSWKDAGSSRDEVYQLLDASRELHSTDSDERRYDAVLDVMDLVSGWCRPAAALW